MYAVSHFILKRCNATVPKTDSQSASEYLNAFVNYIYDNFDAFKLVICRSAGTKYEHYIHDLVELEISVAEKYYRLLRKRGKLEGTMSRELHHMITSAYFTAVFETVAHDMSRKKRLSMSKSWLSFLTAAGTAF